MANAFHYFMSLFESSSVPHLTEVLLRPESGFKYVFEWENSAKKEEWRTDDYRWKQDGKCKFCSE
jgi:hypothetical protein